MSKGLYKTLVIFFLAAMMVVFNHCGVPFGKPTFLKFGNGNQVVTTVASIDAFKKTVYPITRARCASCHVTQAPTHAHEDPQIAMNAIVGQFKVDFDVPGDSRLVKKLRNEQHNCWGECAANADEMQAAITAWAMAIKSAPTTTEELPTGEVDTSIKTEPSRSIATELADPKNRVDKVVSISFDLSAFIGFSNVWFVVDVAEYDEYSYKFSNPRIQTPTEKIYVKGVKLLLNDKYNPQNALYTVVEKTTTTTDRILSTSAMIAEKDKGSDKDILSVSFEKLRFVNDQDQSYVAFEDTVWQVTRGNCSSCHSGASPAGHAQTSPSRSHDVVISRQLVNFGTPTSSPLYDFLKRQRHNCGTSTDCDDLAAQMLQAIEDWKTRR